MTATGTWIAASYILGRPVPTAGPYPHICGRTVTSPTNPRRRIHLSPTQCAACTQRHHRRLSTPERAA